MLLAVALKALRKSSCYLIDAETKGEGDGVMAPWHSHRRALKGAGSLHRSALPLVQEGARENLSL